MYLYETSVGVVFKEASKRSGNSEVTSTLALHQMPRKQENFQTRIPRQGCSVLKRKFTSVPRLLVR